MISILVVLTYCVMIAVNIVANTLPINNITTGGVSDTYANLFAPAGITFSIWLLIYLLLFGYTVYQLNCFKDLSHSNKRFFRRIGILFSASSIANALWIFAWHYDFIGLSLVLMVTILGCLIGINSITASETFTSKDRYFIRLPFEVYFGWITVATIANVTVLLVKLGWSGLGLSEGFWASFAIILGALIGSYNIHYYKSPVYGTVIVWAYAGIILKHVSTVGYGGRYIEVIVTAGLGIVMLVIAEWTLLKKIRG